MRLGYSTCWEMIEGAADGCSGLRDDFARRYTPVVHGFLRYRWRGTSLLSEVDDATSEVFVECFRLGGVLEKTDPTRSGGFRAFFYGVIRNIARRFEEARANSREQQQPSTAFDLDEQTARETSLSQVFDRSWAESILNEARTRYRLAAEQEGEEALRRVDLLRLRFEDDVPIREIATRWKVDVDKVHQQYRLARREFRRCFEAELASRGEGLGGRWQELLALLR